MMTLLATHSPVSPPSNVENVTNLSVPSTETPVADAFLPLVWKVARQIARRLPTHISVDELVGAGTLGLMAAIDRFDPARADQFPGYAEMRVRGAILDQLREMDHMPRWARTKRKRVEAATMRLQQSLGRAPEATELACALEMDVEQLERLRCDVSRADVRSGVELDTCASRQAGPEEIRATRELRERLAVALSGLTPRQKHLIGLYYVDGLKLREIGEVFGVSESRVCQLHAQLSAQLHDAMLDD